LRTPAWDVLFGSVTLHLWERADCDLLLVPG
jgi:nucleotide-binding universal stress UspA family protein